MKDHREYEVVLMPQADGGFTVSVPDLPDVVTEADTREKALTMAKDVAEGYLEATTPCISRLRISSTTPRLSTWKDRTQRHVFRRWFDDALSSRGALAVIEGGNGNVIGTSRFDQYDETQSEVEIGWTILARSHWGGAYNGDMKRLMLRHAFASVDAVRFSVHSLNLRSQRAVEKLGAVRVSAELDPHGRGENYIFRLERSRFV